MKTAAKELRFEDAAHYRDLLKHYEQLEVDLGSGPLRDRNMFF